MAQATQKIGDIMTRNPVCLSPDATAQEAANRMAETDVGCVLVTEQDGSLRGLVTDRDLIIRVLAAGKDPERTAVREVCSDHVAHLSPDDSIDNAVKLMAKKAVRRIPVMEGRRPVGVVSLGDLAVERDRRSALGEISAAPPNH